MESRSVYGKVVAGSVLVGLLAGFGLPALAATSSSGSAVISYSATSGCSTCRTLVLLEQDGKTPLTGLDLSSGSNGFIADVVDSGVDPAALGNFSVAATMSNLYQYDSATKAYNCGVSIPSGDVSLNSSPALLDASGLSSTVQPVFQIAGNLSGILTSTLIATLGLSSVNTSVDITGVQAQTDAALNQLAEAGNTAPSILTGSLLDGTGLPMTLGAGAGGPFTNPAAPPSSTCSGSGNMATSVPVLSGLLATNNPLLTDAESLIGAPTVTQMISAGYLTAQEAETLISQATGISSTVLDGTSGLLSSIENTLTGSVMGLVSSATTMSGTYGAEPVMTVSAPAATPATYQGLLTVTLTSP